MEFLSDEQLEYDEYVEFLRHSDIGHMYPRERFAGRLRRLLAHYDVCTTARDSGQLVGVCLGLTDFAYFLFLTDLGVHRSYTGQGIGRRLVKDSHDLAGGEADITMFTHANEDAIGFYEKCGLKRLHRGMIKECSEFTEFTVQ